MTNIKATADQNSNLHPKTYYEMKDTNMAPLYTHPIKNGTMLSPGPFLILTPSSPPSISPMFAELTSPSVTKQIVSMPIPVSYRL